MLSYYYNIFSLLLQNTVQMGWGLRGPVVSTLLLISLLRVWGAGSIPDVALDVVCLSLVL